MLLINIIKFSILPFCEEILGSRRHCKILGDPLAIIRCKRPQKNSRLAHNKFLLNYAFEIWLAVKLSGNYIRILDLGSQNLQASLCDHIFRAVGAWHGGPACVQNDLFLLIIFRDYPL